MLLVKPDSKTHVGLIAIPGTAQSAGFAPGDYHDTYTGTVVATGPGDKHKPIGSFYCSKCHQKHVYDPVADWYRCGCHCAPVTPGRAARWNESRFPMLVKVGDRVAFPRRPNMPGGEFFVTLEGEKYMMFHEEQCAFAVLGA
jgi:hypothetical protein